MRVVYERYRDMPLLVRVLTLVFDGWIVGGGAKYLVGQVGELPDDWDVAVPPVKWTEVVRIVPHQSVTNTWGGFKIDGVDFWPEDLGHHFAHTPHQFGTLIAVHPSTQRVAKCKL